jgi:hypothetical protein
MEFRQISVGTLSFGHKLRGDAVLETLDRLLAIPNMLSKQNRTPRVKKK